MTAVLHPYKLHFSPIHCPLSQVPQLKRTHTLSPLIESAGSVEESAIGADVCMLRPRKLNLLGRPPGIPKFTHNIESHCEKSLVYLLDELSTLLVHRTTKRSYLLVLQQTVTRAHS